MTALGRGPGVFYLESTGDLLPAAPLPSTAASCRKIAGSKHGGQAALLESCPHGADTEASLVALTHDVPPVDALPPKLKSTPRQS